ncbi:MAG TPA: hypothetical protein VFO55_13405 [Gemmatimonadaceae bacterium]|nr:hypothetical protein [Gemmatimonadaceae bacterium]
MIGNVGGALRRCRPFALSIFFTYVIASSTGMVMAHSGSRLALTRRDATVREALATDRSSIAYRAGDRMTAAVHDFAGNLFYAAIPQTVAGLGVVLPYFTVAYQGWIGGIVSVDGAHRSRLRTLKGASYYIIVLVLQFIPFSLSIGAGVRCGVELYRRNADVSWRFWRYRIPRETVLDVGRVYAVSVPLFFVASLFEFLSTWNA